MIRGMAIMGCALSFAGGCFGDGGGSAQGSAGIANGGAGAESGPGGATLPSGAGLTGTWEITATGDVEPAGTVKVGAGLLEAAFGEYELRFQRSGANMTVEWDRPAGRIVGGQIERYTETIDVDAQHQPGAMQSGDIPLELGGLWSFTSSTHFCDADVAPERVVGSCNASGRSFRLPGNLPDIDGSFTAVRTMQTVSNFGDFGGRWEAMSNEGGSCVATFRTDVFSIACDGSNDQLTVTFDGDMLSGTLEGRLEFVGMRL